MNEETTTSQPYRWRQSRRGSRSLRRGHRHRSTITVGPPERPPPCDLSIWALFLQADWIVKAVMIMLLLRLRSGAGRSSSTRSIRLRGLNAKARQVRRGLLVRRLAWKSCYDRIASRPTDPMASIFVAAMREWRRSGRQGALLHS